jgi:hypothetical protein
MRNILLHTRTSGFLSGGYATNEYHCHPCVVLFVFSFFIKFRFVLFSVSPYVVAQNNLLCLDKKKYEVLSHEYLCKRTLRGVQYLVYFFHFRRRQELYLINCSLPSWFSHMGLNCHKPSAPIHISTFFWENGPMPNINSVLSTGLKYSCMCMH